MNIDFDIKIGCCCYKCLKYVSKFATRRWVETEEYWSELEKFSGALDILLIKIWTLRMLPVRIQKEIKTLLETERKGPLLCSISNLLELFLQLC